MKKKPISEEILYKKMYYSTRYIRNLKLPHSVILRDDSLSRTHNIIL